MISNDFLKEILQAIEKVPHDYYWNYDNNRTSHPPANMWTWPDNTGGVEDDNANPIDLFTFGDMTSHETGEDEAIYGIPDDDPRNDIGNYLEHVSPCVVKQLVEEIIDLRKKVEE